MKIEKSWFMQLLTRLCAIILTVTLLYLAFVSTDWTGETRLNVPWNPCKTAFLEEGDTCWSARFNITGSQFTHNIEVNHTIKNETEEEVNPCIGFYELGRWMMTKCYEV